MFIIVIWEETNIHTIEVEIKKIKISIEEIGTNMNANQPLTEVKKDGIIIKIQYQFPIIAEILILLLLHLIRVPPVPVPAQVQIQALFAHRLSEGIKLLIINVEKEKNLIIDIE